MAANQVVEGLWEIPLGFVNAFLVESDDGLTVIDTGVAGSAQAILDAVRSIGRQAGDVRRILVTHCHSDHAGSLAELNMEQQADLIAHYYAAKFLARPPYAAELPRFQAALAGFLADPHDKAMLPRYRNTLKWFA